MGNELDQVSMEIGKLNAKVEGIEDHIGSLGHSINRMSEKLDSMVQDKRDTRAKIIGLGAGLGLAGGSAVQGAKAIIDKLWS